MAATNAEVSRDNPEMLFVTAFAGILDLGTGVLAYCNAGHENPLLVAPESGAVRVLDDGAGPPLCAVDDYVYTEAHCRMRPGEGLCVITDGVTEARRASGDLYGGERVRGTLLGLAQSTLDARALVDALRADVDAFAAGAEPADDLTVLVLCWNGPGAAGSAASG